MAGNSKLKRKIIKVINITINIYKFKNSMIKQKSIIKAETSNITTPSTCRIQPNLTIQITKTPTNAINRLLPYTNPIQSNL